MEFRFNEGIKLTMELTNKLQIIFKNFVLQMLSLKLCYGDPSKAGMECNRSLVTGSLKLT
jgi:hypothetical protein